jgi:hypothetical protein
LVSQANASSSKLRSTPAATATWPRSSDSPTPPASGQSLCSSSTHLFIRITS